MSRMILKERLGRVEDLKKFSWEGFMFRPDLSDSNVMMFVQEGVWIFLNIYNLYPVVFYLFLNEDLIFS